MAIAKSHIEELLKKHFPDAQITIQDLAGDGDHYACLIKSEAFRGVPRVKQHKMVYAALEGHMGEALHALALQTQVPSA